MSRDFCLLVTIIALTAVSAGVPQGGAQEQAAQSELDTKVREFLDRKRGDWQWMSVPEQDGRLLYDIIVRNNYTRALEIGTYTGHSAIWIAWALSKTGGKLVTIDIDESSLNEARRNFREAGLSEFIETRLADAHELVPRLEGPFDFVFCDADKGWYRNYFLAVEPKLTVGGCYTAHNVRKSGGRRGIREFIDYVRGLRNYDTTIDESGAGLSVSYKRSDR